MRQASFTDVRHHAAACFDVVKWGGVRVLHNGKTIADNVPVLLDLPPRKRCDAELLEPVGSPAVA